MKRAFNISTFELPRYVVPSIKGYAEDIYQAVHSFGLKHKQPEIMDSPVKRTDMSVCSSTSHRSAHGLARQSTFVRSSMNGFRRLSRQSGTTRCPFSAMWTMCWNSTFPPIRTRLRRNTENEVPNCFKPRKSCQQSYSYLPAAICCG